MQVKVGNREQKEVDYFNYLGYTSMLTRDRYCLRKINMRIVMDKEAFIRKISLLTSKLSMNSGRNWLGVMFGALIYIAQRPGY